MVGLVELKILRSLVERGEARYGEIKRDVGAADKVVWELLIKLESKGYVEKIEKGRYRVTEKGKEVYEAKKRAEVAEKTININKVIEAFKARLKKTMPYLEPFLTDDKLEALAKYYGIVLTLALYKPYSARCAELVDQLASSLKTVALTPPPEKSEEEEAFIEALLFFLTHLLKCGSFREKVAKERRLTFLLDLDLSSVQLTDEDLRAALFFGLVYQGLRKEGKI
ncbi:MAG: hypothetical protein QXT30_03710 [Candidatus Bathyarchaeia archaeon]